MSAGDDQPEVTGWLVTRAAGALAAGVAWLNLQYVGVAYVSRVVQANSATNGVFAVALGLLAFLYLVSVVIVICIELNVVTTQRLYPRALLTPFTSNNDRNSALAPWLEHYNTQRRHTALRGLPPTSRLT